MGRFFEDEFDLVDLEFAVFEMFDTFIRVGPDGPADPAGRAGRVGPDGPADPVGRTDRAGPVCVSGLCVAADGTLRVPLWYTPLFLTPPTMAVTFRVFWLCFGDLGDMVYGKAQQKKQSMAAYRSFRYHAGSGAPSHNS